MNATKPSVVKEHSYSVLSDETSANSMRMKEWVEFDNIISRFLIEQRIPGASIAVAKGGTILYEQGYGVAGASCRVNPDSVFRIASISKPITATILIKLCEQCKISINTLVFGKNGILKKYKTRDKRMKKITIKHLLQHSAGWDRDKVGDAVFVRPKCVVKEHPDTQAYNSALLSYALRRKLQFCPGKWHSYSNLGYLVLGEIVEQLSGLPYHVVMSSCLESLNIKDIKLGRRQRADWLSKEVEYFNNREPVLVDSIYPEEGEVLPQYGGMAMESSGSYGGLIANTNSLLQFLHSMETATKNVDVHYENADDVKPPVVYDGGEFVAQNEFHKALDVTQEDGKRINDQLTSFLYQRLSGDKNCSRSDLNHGSTEEIPTISSLNQVQNEDQILLSSSELSDANSDLKIPEMDVAAVVQLPVTSSQELLSAQNTELTCEDIPVSNKHYDDRSFVNKFPGLNVKRHQEISSECVKEVESSKETNKQNNCEIITSDHFVKNLPRPVPLFTPKQVKESLSRPSYENGRDWYGLGWDVQDDGKSWGHTGGMEGSCGTLFHHKSGLNWAFLLNSWAVDSDLNGVIKCALCCVQNLKIYNCDVSRSDNGQGVKIMSQDKFQVILLGVSEETVRKVVSELQPLGYFLTWIAIISQDITGAADGLVRKNPLEQKKFSFEYEFMKSEDCRLRYSAIFCKCSITNYFVVFNRTTEELNEMIHKYKKDGFVINFLDTYCSSIDNNLSELKFTAVFKQNDELDFKNVTAHLAIKATDYVKKAKLFIKSDYILVQSVTEVNEELLVSVILLNKTEGDLNVAFESNKNSNRSRNSAEAFQTMLQKDYFSKGESFSSSSSTLKCPKTKKCQSKAKCTKLQTDSIYWVQISPESFLTELNKQVIKKNGLVYAKFYTVNNKPYVSACWSPMIGGNRYQRTALSKYGLVPELAEAASENVRLQCLSEYLEEDGTVYFAALWHADERFSY